MIHSVKNIHTIVIHCSASREDKDYTFDQLLADHKLRGFTTCGYHIYIRKSGSVFIGRPLTMKCAHVSNNNTNTIGICYEGGCDSKMKPKDTRTDQQKIQIIASIRLVLKAIQDAGGDVRKVKVKGHRDFSPDTNKNGVVEPSEWIKACPCFDAIPEYEGVEL